MAARQRGHHPEVVSITSAPPSPRQELGQRERRYIVSMAIRTACFVAAVVVGPGWLRWVLVAGAFLLPYVAVIMANSASPRIEGTGPMAPVLPHPELDGREERPRDQPTATDKRGTI